MGLALATGTTVARVAGVGCWVGSSFRLSEWLPWMASDQPDLKGRSKRQYWVASHTLTAHGRRTFSTQTTLLAICMSPAASTEVISRPYSYCCCYCCTLSYEASLLLHHDMQYVATLMACVLIGGAINHKSRSNPIWT